MRKRIAKCQWNLKFKCILLLTCLSLGNSGVGNDDWGDTRGLGDGFQVDQTDTTASNDSDLHSFSLLFHNSHGEGRLRADALSILEGEGTALLAECAEGKDCEEGLHGSDNTTVKVEVTKRGTSGQGRKQLDIDTKSNRRVGIFGYDTRQSCESLEFNHEWTVLTRLTHDQILRPS